MAVVLVPVADVAAGTWIPSSGQSLYAVLDEGAADDADYVGVASASTARLRLQAWVDPGSDADHSVRYRARGIDKNDLRVRLTQGSTFIMEWLERNVPSGSVSAYTRNLSTAEAALITDYGDLYIEFEPVIYELVKDWNFETGIRNVTAMQAEFFTRLIYANGTQDKLGNEWQRYSDDNNHVFEADCLALHAYLIDGQPLADGNIKSGMLRSKWYGQYGYFEACLKVDQGRGLWPAFWFVSQDLIWPPEVDIMEIVSNGVDDTGDSFHYVHPGNAADEGAPTFSLLTGDKYVPGFDYAGGYHIFAVEWTPTEARYYVDNKRILVRPFVWKHTSGADGGPAHLILNLAVGGDWPGPPDANTLPADLRCKWIRSWQKRALDPNRSAVILLAGNDNAADGAITFRDQAPGRHSITRTGNVEYDTAQKPAGMVSSLFFDGASYLRAASHADFVLGAQDYTLECMVRFSSLANTCALINLGANWELAFNNTKGIVLWRGSDIIQSGLAPLATNTWHHVALVRCNFPANSLWLFVDGVRFGSNVTDAGSHTQSAITLGATDTGTFRFTGWMASLRITKGVGRYPSAPLPAIPLPLPHL